jgi:hypothetical protein
MLDVATSLSQAVSWQALGVGSGTRHDMVLYRHMASEASRRYALETGLSKHHLRCTSYPRHPLSELTLWIRAGLAIVLQNYGPCP